MKDYIRKSITALLAVMTTFSGMQFTAYAEGTDTPAEDPYVEIIDEETPSETETEPTEDTTVIDEQDGEETVPVETLDENQPVENEEEPVQEETVDTEPAEAEPEETVAEEEVEPTVIGNIYTAGTAAEFAGAVSQIPDNSQNRVMVATDTDLAEVLSKVEFTAVSYEGIYVVEFNSEEEKNSGIEVLKENVGEQNVAEDVVFSIDEKTDGAEAGETETNTEDQSQATAPTIVVTDAVPDSVKLPESTLRQRADSEGKKIVALIDTGANSDVADELVNVTNAYDGTDDNGHGTRMASIIKETSGGDAMILSIKAFDAAGRSNSSTLYAAVKYAIEAGADIINISASANDSADAVAFKSALLQAMSVNIKVVGSAGNKHVDAANVIPVNIDDVIGVTSLDADKNVTGGFGRYVDYGVVASSTSEATATLSGYLATNRFNDFVGVKVFRVNEDGTVADEPVSEDSNWKTDCNAIFYGNVYFWGIPHGATSTAEATLIAGYQQQTLANNDSVANGYGLRNKSCNYGRNITRVRGNGSTYTEWYDTEYVTPGYGYAAFISTYSRCADVITSMGRDSDNDEYIWTGTSYNIAKKDIPGYTYKGYIFNQHTAYNSKGAAGTPPGAPGATTVSSLNKGASRTVEVGEGGMVVAGERSYALGAPASISSWRNNLSALGGWRMDFYYEMDVPTYNVKVTYVDYDDHSNILTPQFVAVKGKQEGETYSYNTAETVTKNGVVYYRKAVDKGGNPAVLSGTMPAEDVEYTVYYRRKFNLTINYVELDNPSNVLKDPTKASYNVDEDYSHEIPYSLTKNSKVYYKNSRSDKNTDMEKVSGKMSNKDVEVTIYYKLGHMIETKVTHGKITRADGKLGPANYMGDWEIAYDAISDHEERTVTYEPQPEYVIDYVKVDDRELPLAELVKALDSYKFADITKDHRIEVAYAENPANPNDSKQVLNAAGEDINKQMVLAGDILTYRVTVESHFHDAKEFTVTDVMPTETEYVDGSAGATGGVYDPAKRMLTWKFTMDPLEEKALEFKVRVLDEAKGKTEYNTAHVLVNGVTVDTNTVENPVLPDPKKSVMDDEGNDINGTMADPEDVLHYTIHVQNPADAPKLFKVSDKMINQTVIESSISHNGTVAGDTIKWEVNIPAKSSVTLKFDAKANGYDLKIPNTATVAVDKVTIDTNETVIWTPPVPVKSVETINGIDINGKSIKLNDEFYYKIEVRNNSELKKSYVVKDSIPEEVKFIEAGHYAGSYVKGGSGAMAQDARNVTWTFELDPGEERILYIKGRLEATDVTFANRATQIVDKSVAESNEVTNWSGRIIINAEIEEYYEPYGQPSFIYSITDKNGTGNTWHRMIIIDTETRKGQAIFDIPTGYGPDTWVVKDEKNARYTFVSATPETTNFTTEGNTGTGLITQTSRVGIVDYLYRITKWDETSHMDAVTNTVNYKRS